MSRGLPILLVESDRRYGFVLARELTADGLPVALAHSGEHALALAALHAPRIALLGRLGTRAPQTLLEEIRAGGGWDCGLPVLVLGDEAGGLEALRAFDAGADDFMARPVSYLELRARVRAILSRAPGTSRSRILQAGRLRVDLDARRASLDGTAIELSRMEFELLTQLARAPERVIPRDELLSTIWGHPAGAATRTVDTHASRLRRKLIAASGEPWIAAVRGVGYRLI